MTTNMFTGTVTTRSKGMVTNRFPGMVRQV